MFKVNNFSALKKLLITGLVTSFYFHSNFIFLGGMRKGDKITILSHICKRKFVHHFLKNPINCLNSTTRAAHKLKVVFRLLKIFVVHNQIPIKFVTTWKSNKISKVIIQPLKHKFLTHKIPKNFICK